MTECMMESYLKQKNIGAQCCWLLQNLSTTVEEEIKNPRQSSEEIVSGWAFDFNYSKFGKQKEICIMFDTMKKRMITFIKTVVIYAF